MRNRGCCTDQHERRIINRVYRLWVFCFVARVDLIKDLMGEGERETEKERQKERGGERRTHSHTLTETDRQTERGKWRKEET